MLQIELAKRLRGRFETEMDGDGWLALSSDSIPLRRVKYNGNCIVNDKPNLTEEYLGKIAAIQNELLTTGFAAAVLLFVVSHITDGEKNPNAQCKY